MSAEQMPARNIEPPLPESVPLGAGQPALTQEFDDALLRESPATQPASVVRSAPRRSRAVAAALTGGLLVAIVGVIVGLAAIAQSFDGRIYPNVSVQGLSVGNLTRSEARAVLRSHYGTFLDQPATIIDGERQWRPGLDELGIVFDFDAAIDAAYQVGRESGAVDNLRRVSDVRQNGVDVALTVTFDQAIAQQYLAQLAAEVDYPATDAALRITGTSVDIQPARPGRQILVDATLAELTEGLRQFQPTTVTLLSREIAPRLLDAPAQTARTQIQTILREPLTLWRTAESVQTLDPEAEDRQYVWSPSELARLIQITRVAQPDGDTLAVSLDASAIEERVRQIADETEVIGTRPRVAWNGGDLRIIRPGDPGKRVDEVLARDRIVAALFGTQRTLDLPMRATEPPVSEKNLDQLGISELVGVGLSDFTGSAEYRITNIGVGMNLLNGILIAPDEEFSFNQYIGSIDAENGFVEGYAIVQNRTQLEFGGGICQDSTTIFRAAFWSGLPITERWGHSFYISWYDKYGLGPLGDGPGLDATIFTGGPDLKFLNDTGHWLLVQASSNPKTGHAQVDLYGTSPQREVAITYEVYDRIPAIAQPVFVADADQPAGRIRQSDRARGGMTIDVWRTVTVNGVAAPRELFRTRFKPWPNIYVVNPADMGPDGRPTIEWRSPDDPSLRPTPTPDSTSVPGSSADVPPTPAPETEATPAPEAEATPAPEAEATPAPEAEATPAPETEATPTPAP